MGDEDHQHPRPGERTRQIEQPLGLARRQGRRGFVEDKHGRCACERLRDFDDLALRQRQPPHFDIRARCRDVEAFEELGRLSPERRSSDRLEEG
jgi:hypothetical protein